MCGKQLLSASCYAVILLLLFSVKADPAFSSRYTAADETIYASIAQETLDHVRALGVDIRRAVSGSSSEDLHPHRFLSFRQCANDTTELYENNPELESAEEQVMEDFDEEFDRKCGNMTDNDRVCIVDENDLASTSAYAEACRAAGGTIYEYNLLVQCEIQLEAGGQSETLLRIHWENNDICVDGSSCDPNEIAAAVELSADDSLEDMVEFSVGSVQVRCDSDVTFLNSSAMSIFTGSFSLPFISSMAGFIMSVTVAELLF